MNAADVFSITFPKGGRCMTPAFPPKSLRNGHAFFGERLFSVQTPKKGSNNYFKEIQHWMTHFPVGRRKKLIVKRFDFSARTQFGINYPGLHLHSRFPTIQTEGIVKQGGEITCITSAHRRSVSCWPKQSINESSAKPFRQKKLSRGSPSPCATWREFFRQMVPNCFVLHHTSQVSLW